MFDKKDYMAILNRARKKRNQNDYIKYIVIAACVILAIILIVLAGRTIGKKTSGKPGKPTETQTDQTASPSDASDSAEETPEDQESIEIEAVINSYQNLGLVQVTGYLNMRETASTDADVIGKLSGDAGCEILETEAEWYKISSGGIEGYIHSEYVLSGEEAKEKARELVKPRAIIRTDKLNIRKEPNTEAEVVGQVVENERYEVVSEPDGWVEISSGFISADYVEVKYALNEARKLDLKSMIFNLYDNLGISNVSNFLNVRDNPSEDGKVIAKMPSKSAGDILETLDGWYKIKSGNITGYVKSDYILTGAAAKDEALNQAELMAVVNTDMLNVRAEPSTESKIWTQISNNERYNVLKQIDGWVEIELDSTSAYVSTDFVDVRYALGEAVKFSPLEEKANAQASLRTQIVNYALQFLGNPYVWGGTSLTKGADCSGFTMSVLGKFGIGLPHYSGSQAQRGKAVSSSEMRPGDLIFYTDSRGTINHVAMYIGNGQIVHAANRRSGIKISNYNYRKPAKIRNVID